MENLKTKLKDGGYWHECGGQLMIDATVTKRVPLGLGFVGPKFQVDYAEVKGYRGVCLECGKEGFIRDEKKKPRRVTKYPAGINKKLAAIAGGVR